MVFIVHDNFLLQKRKKESSRCYKPTTANSVSADPPQSHSRSDPLEFIPLAEHRGTLRWLHGKLVIKYQAKNQIALLFFERSSDIIEFQEFSIMILILFKIASKQCTIICSARFLCKVDY
jgi:hypothetical protein